MPRKGCGSVSGHQRSVFGADHDPAPRPSPGDVYLVFGQIEPDTAPLETGLASGEGIVGKVWFAALIGDEPDLLEVVG